MKKLILCLAFIGFLGQSAVKAQDTKIEETFKTYRFGLYVGPSLNSLRPSSDVYNGYEIKKGKGNTGLSFGITVDYNVNERYTITSGLSLDWRGGSLTSTKDTLTPLESGYAKEGVVKYKQQYVTLPIGLKLKAIEKNDMSFFVQTGFDVSFLLSNRGTSDIIKADGTALLNRGIVNLNQEGVGKAVPINFGWFIGPGMEYKINEANSIFVSLIYRNGFTDVTAPQNNKNGFRFSDGNIRSNALGLRIGYYF